MDDVCYLRQILSLEYAETEIRGGKTARVSVYLVVWELAIRKQMLVVCWDCNADYLVCCS